MPVPAIKTAIAGAIAVDAGYTAQVCDARMPGYLFSRAIKITILVSVLLKSSVSFLKSTDFWGRR